MTMPHDPDADLRRWTPPPPPQREVIEGRYVRLEPLAEAHAGALHAGFAGRDFLWDFMGYGPFPDEGAYAAWIREAALGLDPLFMALVDRATGRPGGVAAWLRVQPAAGSIELGHICLSPEMARSRAATEAFFLLMDNAFSMGYRRFEWKCNALNLPSRRAAQRLGFGFEGVHRQHMVVKQRNRDTAWFAILDGEWPGLRAAFETWLDPANFDAAGRQLQRLSVLTAACGPIPDPAV